MLTDSEFCCPLCGLVLTSLHAFHQHLAKVHNSRAQQAARPEPGPAVASYANGCPILDDKIEVQS